MSKETVIRKAKVKILISLILVHKSQSSGCFFRLMQDFWMWLYFASSPYLILNQTPRNRSVSFYLVSLHQGALQGVLEEEQVLEVVEWGVWGDMVVTTHLPLVYQPWKVPLHSTPLRWSIPAPWTSVVKVRLFAYVYIYFFLQDEVQSAKKYLNPAGGFWQQPEEEAHQ